MRARAVRLMLYPVLCAFAVCAVSAPALGCGGPARPRPQPPAAIGAQDAAQSGAVMDVQDQALARSASQGEAPAGPGAGFPTGRLGESWHSAYINLQPGQWPGYTSKSSEQSLLASGYYNFPQSVLGGSVQAGAFGGEDWVTTGYKPPSSSPAALLGTKASNNSYLGGGYILYSLGSNYAMNTFSIFEGTTRQSGAAFIGSSASYGTHGLVNTTVAGHVFDLSGMAGFLKMDVRGGLLYSNAYGDQFADRYGQLFRSSVEEWTAALSATLFEDLALSADASVRPYLKAGLKQQLDYSNKLEVSFHGAATAYRFGQSPTLGGAEIGFDYMRAGVTVTGAVYGEAAADQGALGGRLGAKFAF